MPTLELKEQLSTIRTKFFALKNRLEIAELLEVSDSILRSVLYSKKAKYKKFEIQKKNGTKRPICAPLSGTKVLQQKINYILQEILYFNSSANGFISGRSVVTGARPHVKSKFVLNIDIENFFGSIHIGRVRGLFMSRPFKFSNEVATVLAQLCCFESVTPQGAPTSPVISNMICKKLDKQLGELANRYGCTYTRYADDITFSTRDKSFPEGLATQIGNNNAKLSDELVSIFETNKFRINHGKTRLFSHTSRQVVTGLVVNTRVNVPRSYVRKVRAILNNWKHLGIAKVQLDLENDSTKILNRRGSDVPDITLVIGGMVNYIGTIRGSDDDIYRKLRNKYLECLGKSERVPLVCKTADEVKKAVRLIETGAGNGTGFYLDKFGLVTCFHVVKTAGMMQVRRFSSGLWEIEANYAVKKRGDECADIALLDAKQSEFALKIAPQKTLSEDEKYWVYGLPSPININSADPVDRRSFEITAKVPVALFDGVTPHHSLIYGDKSRYRVDGTLYGGMSGAPVVNEKCEVVGIVILGQHRTASGPPVLEHVFMPIWDFLSVIR